MVFLSDINQTVPTVKTTQCFQKKEERSSGKLFGSRAGNGLQRVSTQYQFEHCWNAFGEDPDLLSKIIADIALCIFMTSKMHANSHSRSGRPVGKAVSK